MASWVMRRAQVDRGRLEVVQKAGILWEQLRSHLQKSVDEFDSLYADSPDRQAEYSENGDSAAVKLKMRPSVCAELNWDATSARLRYVITLDRHSELAAETLIFGFWNPAYEYQAGIDSAGQPCFISDGRTMAPQELAEAVLAPLLFPN